MAEECESVDLLTGKEEEKQKEEEAEKPELIRIICDMAENEDEVDKVQACLDLGHNVNGEDASGMTALMHAAWKGKLKTVKKLIDQGADVNGGNHEHDYSPLHFAALANKEQICQVLIENGAKIDAVNSVKRTASQMAAFVGNSKCVAVINNYVPKEDVFYFTRKQPLEEKAKMPLKLAKPLHELVMITNTNPVRIGLELKARPELLELENLEKMCQILELMSDREFKDRRDVNEVLSLKFHIIHYVVKDIKKQTEKEVQQEKQMKLPLIDRWIKSMLLARESDGYQVFQEDFLRQGVKEFPYKESTLFKTLVTNFSQSRNYGESLTASDFINQAFNGQKGFNDDDSCGACGNEKTEKKCSKCKSKNYCDQNCQKLHWFVHKKFCN